MKKIKNIRLKYYDYKSDGFYFITIISNYRKTFSAADKEIIESYLNNIGNICSGVKLDFYKILNNHIPFIISLSDSELPLGEVVRRFKALTSKQTKTSLWQPNYFEHVVRYDRSLKRIREYIENKPLKQILDFDFIYQK